MPSWTVSGGEFGPQDATALAAAATVVSIPDHSSPTRTLSRSELAGGDDGSSLLGLDPRSPLPAAVPSKVVPALHADLQEYFRGVITYVDEESVLLTAVSSDGEESEIEIDTERVPESERPFLMVDAPIRVAILRVTKPTGQQVYQSRIRVLRPSQWRLDDDAERSAANYLIQRMKDLVDEPGSQ